MAAMSLINHLSKIPIPDEILNLIFQYLPAKELGQCSLVNSIWMRISKAENIWKLHYPQNIVRAVAPLVERSILTWRDVGVLDELVTFLEKIAEDQYVNDDWLVQENPKLKGQEFVSLIIAKAYAKYGKFEFSVSNSVDVKVKNLDSEKEFIISGTEGKALVNLCVDQGCLYALRDDGLIVSWNAKGDCLGQIETAYYKQDKDLMAALKGTKFYGLETFVVKNNIMAIKYGQVKHGAMEFISCSDPKKRYLIIDPIIKGQSKLRIVGEKVISMGMNQFSCWDPHTGKKEGQVELSVGEDYLCDVSKAKDVFYAGSSGGSLYIIDKNLEVAEFIGAMELSSSIISVVNGLVFRFVGYNREMRNIQVINKEGVVLKTLEDVIDAKGRCIAENVLGQLVLECKKHRQERRSLQNQCWCIVS